MSEIKNNRINGLTTAEWQQLLTLFDELVEQPNLNQAQLIQSLGLSKPGTELLKKMLNAHNYPNLLDQTIDPLVEALLGSESVHEHSNPADILGRTFGVWKAIDTLGTGGMGQVFVAERADGHYEKQVALKVIKSGGFSEYSQQRFLTEMRILAQFEHPNIAHLIDGGTSDEGIVYFVMELVIGEPIVEYANGVNLSLNQRIHLVLQVIDAVEYAHQNLIIHGDIKPANILVNHGGQVKLVDFGIARSMKGDESSRFLPQFTPSYSAPEQAQGKDLTTASDVFGICAVLYELCTGSAPRDQARKTTQLDYTDSIIMPIPAAYKKYKQNKVQKKQLLKNRENQKTEQALSKELGCIIDKGLQIKIIDRYQNTTKLRRDLLLFLAGSAVSIYSDSKFYRWQKTAAKFKWPVFISGLALLVIMASALVAIKQAKLAQQEADKALWMNQFLMSIFTAADPVKNQIKPITVNELTGLAATDILQDSHNNVLKTAALELLSKIQHRLGEIESSQLLNDKQIELLELTPSSQLQLAGAHNEGGLIALTQNDFEQSIRHYQQAMLLAPLSQDANEQSFNAAIGMADSLIRLDRPKDAGPIIQSLKQHQDKLSVFINSDLMRAKLYILYAKLAKSHMDFSEALLNVNEAKKLANKVTDNAMLFPEVLGIESDIYFEQGAGLKAEEIDRQLVSYYTEKFGNDHPRTIDSLSNLAVSLLSLGKIKETIAVNKQLINILHASGITDHQEAASYLNLGIAYDILGEYEEAIKNLEIAEHLWPTLTPRYLYYDALTYVSLAHSYLSLNAYDLSAQYYQLGLSTLAQEYGVGNHRYAWFEVKYTALLIEIGEFTKAKKILLRVRDKISAVYGENGKRTVLTDLQLAQIAAAEGDEAQAQQKASRTLQILDMPNVRDRYPAEVALAKKILGK